MGERTWSNETSSFEQIEAPLYAQDATEVLDAIDLHAMQSFEKELELQKLALHIKSNKARRDSMQILHSGWVTKVLGFRQSLISFPTTKQSRKSLSPWRTFIHETSFLQTPFMGENSNRTDIPPKAAICEQAASDCADPGNTVRPKQSGFFMFSMNRMASIQDCWTPLGYTPVTWLLIQVATDDERMQKAKKVASIVEIIARSWSVHERLTSKVVDVSEWVVTDVVADVVVNVVVDDVEDVDVVVKIGVQPHLPIAFIPPLDKQFLQSTDVQSARHIPEHSNQTWFRTISIQLTQGVERPTLEIQ
jgi:hypothetical protein